MDTPLSLDAIASLLSNPFYMGIIRIDKTGELFEGVHQALVSKSLFDRVQDIKNGRVFARPLSHDFVFRRMARCGACPRTLTGEAHRGHSYYRCHSRDCKGTSCRETDVSTAVVSMLAELEWDDEELKDLRDIVGVLIGKERDGEARRDGLIRRNLANTAERIDRLADLLIAEDIDSETYQRKRSALLENSSRMAIAAFLASLPARENTGGHDLQTTPPHRTSDE